MNYIKELEHDKVMLSKATLTALLGLHELEEYLTSDKFREDTTVQTQDILNRIRGLTVAVITARDGF